MSKSQNGWSVVDRDQCVQSRVHGVTFPNGIRRGDVQFVMDWVADRYHRTVEPLVAGTCWGWFQKPIEGTATISNHSSGTAYDFNAPQHPMGTPASKNFTAAQIKACHAIVAACDGVIRWGGDYSGRPDPMHWEIVGTAAEVSRLATKIKKQEAAVADVTLSAQTKADIGVAVVGALNTVDGVFRAPSWRGDQSNTEWPFEDVFTTVYERIEANQQAIMLDQQLIKTQLANIMTAIGEIGG